MNGTDSGQRKREKEAAVFEFRHRQVNADQPNECAMSSHCAIAMPRYKYKPPTPRATHSRGRQSR